MIIPVPDSLVAHIGGTFLYSADPGRLAEWYQTHLQMPFTSVSKEHGGYNVFFYNDLPAGDSEKIGRLGSVVFSIGKLEDGMPAEGRSRGMINYKVHSMQAVVEHLATLGVTLAPDHYPGQGYFAHLNDIDGNRIELWEDQFDYAAMLAMQQEKADGLEEAAA
jgi:glyoxylase I family protein